MPKIRAFALQRWKAAVAAPEITTTRGYPWSEEVDTFWDWALLELLVQSGLRIEEASELTTFDILKRKMPDGRIYYLLHIKPSKFDRARVIPIGDGLGRVLAEIIRYVKRFYNSESVPVCDHWDLLEKRPRPPAPYLIQSIRHPSTAGIQTIRTRIREISITAEARRSDGSPLVLLPHDYRRVFAPEHLNNNMPVHVIQALLGHASPDTVMIYAKLYPSQLIEEYRKTVRNLYKRLLRRRRSEKPDRGGMGGLRGELQPARHGHAPLRLAYRRALSEGIDLPWLCACAAKEKCGADFSANASQP
jgi:integrase